MGLVISKIQRNYGGRVMQRINGDTCHDMLVTGTKGILSYDNTCDYPLWKEQVHKKLSALLGMDVIAENACPLYWEVEETTDHEAYRLIRFCYESEKKNFVPAMLLIPKQNRKSYPLAIVLQGHTTGYHISVGEKRFDGDEKFFPNSCFALQAVENGLAALCIEQRGMGITRSHRYPGPGGVHQCSFTAMRAIQLGRTIIGERVWDVSRGIDALEKMDLPEIDLQKIMILGNSGGGTAAFYAACLEKRIQYAAPGCAFCSYKGSILDILHCVCNNIPHASRYFEMEDLACLIAPRPLTVLAGQKDEIFPLEAVKQSYATVQKIYDRAGAENNCKLVVMPEGHFWCPEEAWAAINEELTQLGW